MRTGPMISLATPRAPAAPLDAALYESHYLTAADPAGGRALWLRFTALKRPGEPAHLTTWLTFFDASAGPPGRCGSPQPSRSLIPVRAGRDRAWGRWGRRAHGAR